MTVRAVRAVAQASETGEVTCVRPRAAATVAGPSTESPYLLARSLFKSGNPEGALQILEGEVLAGRESAELLRLMGRAALELGDIARAQRALERAIQLAPDDVVTHVRLARVLLRSRDTAE